MNFSHGLSFSYLVIELMKFSFLRKEKRNIVKLKCKISQVYKQEKEADVQLGAGEWEWREAKVSDVTWFFKK